jgi:hypothetical protein
MAKVVEVKAVVTLEAEVEVAVETMVEDKKRTRKRRTNLTHTAEAEVEEEECRVSTMFNVILVKSMVIMQRSVIIMKRKMMRKRKKGGDGVVLLVSNEVDPNNESVWYLDTGASNHICGYKHMFTEIEEIVDGHVSFGDASKVNVKGQGKILIHCKDGNEIFISNVYYVSDMKINILNLEQLLVRGYTVFMKEITLYLRDQDNSLLAQVEMTKNTCLS